MPAPYVARPFEDDGEGPVAARVAFRWHADDVEELIGTWVP